MTTLRASASTAFRTSSTSAVFASLAARLNASSVAWTVICLIPAVNPDIGAPGR